MKSLVITVAILASFLGIISAPYVSYDSYLIVARQVTLLVVPWVAVWTAFRGTYGAVALCFIVLTLAAFWVSNFEWWGIPLVGAAATLAVLKHYVSHR